MARITESAKHAVSITPIKANTFLKRTYPFTGLIQPKAVITNQINVRSVGVRLLGAPQIARMGNLVPCGKTTARRSLKGGWSKMHPTAPFQVHGTDWNSRAKSSAVSRSALYFEYRGRGHAWLLLHSNSSRSCSYGDQSPPFWLWGQTPTNLAFISYPVGIWYLLQAGILL